jgi:ApbE superfamily uncharacterized protein (UPF0280 family)
MLRIMLTSVKPILIGDMSSVAGVLDELRCKATLLQAPIGSRK